MVKLRTRLSTSRPPGFIRGGKHTLAGDLVEHTAYGTHRVVVAEFFEQESRLVELGLGVVEHSEVSQHVALVGEHSGAAQRIAGTITGAQHRLVDLDGFDEVLLEMSRRGVNKRIGKVELHTGPFGRM